MVESLNRSNTDLCASKGIRAFTRTELLVVIGVFVLFLGLMDFGLPENAKRKAQRVNCMSNLKDVGLALQDWANHHEGYPTDILTNANMLPEPLVATNIFLCFRMMSNELNSPKILNCPADGRLAATDFVNLSNTNISYFLGPNVDETFPAMLLSGDRNLITNGVPISPGFVAIGTNLTWGFSRTLHNSAGNVLLSDGSVQQVSSAGLQQLFQKSGTNVIRLVVP